MASAPLKNKKGTVIHRTTSETLRLGECDLLNHNPIRVSVQSSSNSRKKSQTTSPNCSFQITGVSLTRYDIGDDSADDLDESHTDDISRVTDNETPSFSEDSRDIDEPYQQNHNGPTIPQEILLKPPETADNNKWKEGEKKDANLGRFKVVKIESVAPFSRGRWTCFDYLDHSDNAQVSYNYCKQQGSAASDNEKFKQIPNTSNFWETNCQDSYMFQGNYIIPDGFVSKQKKTRTPFTASPGMLLPHNTKPFRPTFTHSPSLDSTTTVCTAINLETVKEQNMNKTYSLQTQVTTEPHKTSGQQTNETNRASVSCTATIDTKIEHALDVVKNHLTHAVRLEVEELKVKINELVDRISYLEYENDLLRANVTPEVLANLENNGETK